MGKRITICELFALHKEKHTTFLEGKHIQLSYWRDDFICNTIPATSRVGFPVRVSLHLPLHIVHILQMDINDAMSILQKAQAKLISCQVELRSAHYNDVIMSTMGSQITGISIVYSIVYSGWSKQTSKLRVTGLCGGNSRWPVKSPHKGPVTRKMVPFDDVIMHMSNMIEWKSVENRLRFLSVSAPMCKSLTRFLNHF